MIHAATPAETDEAMTTTLLGGGGGGEGRGGGGGEGRGRGDDMGLQFSEGILSSGSTGWRSSWIDWKIYDNDCKLAVVVHDISTMSNYFSIMS